MDLSSLKVALVHEWLVSSRGAERCLEVFCEMFPRSEIFTLFHDPGSVSKAIESQPIHTSFLQKFPGVHRNYRHMLPIMPLAVEQFDLSGFDLVISGNSCVAKGVIVPPGVPHICYMYSPMRYAWDLQWNYFGEESGVRKLRRSVIFQMLHKLRVWDVAAASRVDQFIAVSKFVAKRVAKCYRRESEVVYPPVDVEKFRLGDNSERGDYYLMVTTFEPNKMVDLVVDVFNDLGYQLKIVGSQGRLMRKTQDKAKENIQFFGRVTEDTLIELYARSKGFIASGVEDFGITAVEAIASGTPVIAYSKGGQGESMDFLEEGSGIVRFHRLHPDSLKKAVVKSETSVAVNGMLSVYKNVCRERYGVTRFQNEFARIIRKAYNCTTLFDWSDGE